MLDVRDIGEHVSELNIHRWLELVRSSRDLAHKQASIGHHIMVESMALVAAKESLTLHRSKLGRYRSCLIEKDAHESLIKRLDNVIGGLRPLTRSKSCP
jgi:RecJ-like exonuclease